jgi:hypothetical protein
MSSYSKGVGVESASYTFEIERLTSVTRGILNLGILLSCPL